MTTGTFLFTLAHFALFIYTRRKYVRKYKRASQQLANTQIENMQLSSKLKDLESILDEFGN